MEDLKTKLYQAQLKTKDVELAQLLAEARSRIEILELHSKDQYRLAWDRGHGWGKGKDE